MPVREARSRLACRRPQFRDEMDVLAIATVTIADYMSELARDAYCGAQLAGTLSELEGCDRGGLLHLMPIIKRDARHAWWWRSPPATAPTAETE